MAQSGSGYLIGVDGGGSRCRVALAAADGTVLGTASGPAANPATSLEGAVATIRETLAAACEEARLGEGVLPGARAYLGLAGVINDTLARAVADALPFEVAEVSDDRATNMTGALGDSDGFLAAVGTGSFVGKQSEFHRTFIGGWGLVLGDQASGAWLGRAALSAVLEWRDGLRDGSDLLAGVLAEFEDESAVVLFANDAAPDGFARFAPVVLDAADAGDAVGRALVAEGARYLEAALGVLGFAKGDPLCLIGGIGPRYAGYLGEVFTRALVEPQGSALDGALRLAARLEPGA